MEKMEKVSHEPHSSKVCMMNRKFLVSFVCMVLAVAGLSAFGKRETVDTEAERLDSWMETVDISGKKPGKYNILITAEDLAGNQGFAGPYNMYIDPESDLPVTRVTNPLHGMRVPGNLNIVGTCIDDDAVDYVELVLNGSDTPVRAEGKEFWSYYLDTTGLEEGPHRIDVYGVDIYGVKGHPYTVIWNLDRNRPETRVTNLDMGALVSGKFTLSGVVTDGNGINELYYSVDGGLHYRQLSLKHNRRENLWTFSVNLDSRKMDDGPSVVWFKAVDGQGSEGIYTFLFFVDNTKPDVGFVSPAADEAVNGVFAVTGYARDIIGLQALSWKMGRETGTLEIIKGNPYWYQEFDLRGRRERHVDLEVIAVDIAGNRTVAKRRILLNHAADAPVVTVASPSPQSVHEATVPLSGIAVDDDAVAGVWYSVNKGGPVQIESTGVFAAEISGLPAGRHSVEVWPVDMYGVRGASVTMPFVVSGPAPAISFEPIQAEPAGFSVEAGRTLSGTIASQAGLKSASWQVTGMPSRPIALRAGAQEAAFRIPVTPDFPYGLVSLDIVAVDMFDREVRATQLFYTANLTIPRGTQPVLEESTIRASRDIVIPATNRTPEVSGTVSMVMESLVPDGTPFRNGMNVILSGPGWPRDAQKDGGIKVVIETPVPVTAVAFALNGGAAQRASFQRTADNRFESTIPLNALLPADWLQVLVTATLRDGSTISTEGLVCVLRPQPKAGVNDNEQLVWENLVRNSDNAVLLIDGVQARALYNARPGRGGRSVRLAQPVIGLDVKLEGNLLVVSGSRDGEYKDIRFVIQDSAGDEYLTAPLTFIVDTAPPVVTLNPAMAVVWRQNELRISGEAADQGRIVRLEYSLDAGSTWRQLANKTTGPAATASWSFDELVSIDGMADGRLELLVRAVDGAGRSSQSWTVYQKDTQAPDVRVVIPAPGDIVNGETRIAFDVRDSGKFVKAEYRSPDARSAWQELEISAMTMTMVGTNRQPIAPDMHFRFTDAAGNSTVLNEWQFEIDSEADLPVVEIHLPEENEIIRKDFVVSGVVYDDDEPAKIWYKIDDGTFTEVPIKNSFSIPIELRSLTDNEHTITIYAEDIHGVRGHEVARTIRVSLEEPKAAVQSPSFEDTNKGVVEITGVASDKNGIDRVEISLDNGNTWNLAVGQEKWLYRFDTRVIQDGTHVVFVRVWDKYETMGLYSSLINIDNTAPSITLELPADGSRTGQMLFISGQTMDNITLEQVRAKISNIDPRQPAIPAALTDIVFENELIISRGIDVSVLPEGFYNLEVRGYDRAGNITRVSRNFEVYKRTDRNRVELLYPLNGERVQGMFNIYGRVVCEDPVESLMLVIDGENAAFAEMTPSGYFKFTVTPEMLGEGMYRVSVRALLSGDRIVNSEHHTFIYQPNGPWITIDNFAMGDFAMDRPWLHGTTGYAFTEEEVLAMRSKGITREERQALQAKSLQKVEISFDNGKTFLPTESGRRWRYRLETGDLAEGYHFMVVRATMNNGEAAVTRMIIQVDKTNPEIKLISPSEGGRYNNELVFSGLSSDDVQLDSVLLSLRPGDKSAYAVPAFIQGLYFDWHFWGATLYDVGIGLTFFDDNVKLQAQFGQFTEEQRKVFTQSDLRYGGNVFGVKLLANLAYVPMEFFLGPDFSWLSATAAVGANFSVFSETQSGKEQILSAMLFQVEFPRVTIPKRKTFRTFSFYTEGQLWFIPTDVDSAEVEIQSLLPHLTAGIRLNVF